MAEIDFFIENSTQIIKNLNEKIRQETNYLTFLQCWKKDLEVERMKDEYSIKISKLNSKISSFERKLKSRDSLLTKMDTEMNQMKMINAEKISVMKSQLSAYKEDFKNGVLLRNKLYRAMDEYYIANQKLKEKLNAATIERDENRALYNHIRYSLYRIGSLDLRQILLHRFFIQTKVR